MDQAKQRLLLIEEYHSFLDILDKRGVSFTSPFPESEIQDLSLQDLKLLVGKARDMARTPVG